MWETHPVVWWIFTVRASIIEEIHSGACHAVDTLYIREDLRMYQQWHVAAVVVAAGKSTRMGFDKLFVKIDGVEVVRMAAEKLAGHPYVDEIVLVAGENIPEITALFEANPLPKPFVVVEGGSSRTDSVVAGVQACPGAGLVAIHDAARPFVNEEIITAAIEAAAEVGAAAPAVPVKDTVKRAEGGMVMETLPRGVLRAVQTPQVFQRQLFMQALATVPPLDYERMTDDCMIVEKAGHPVQLVAGSYANYKITTAEDLPKSKGEGEMLLPRVGHGYDVHRFAEGRPLIMGGVNIPYPMGLAGHSDADVLLHAIADALLGAAALGDIGKHFPDTDPAYQGADSLQLLQKVEELVRRQGYTVGNIDATILCQEPKLAPYIAAMRSNIAGVLGLQVSEVSVKATTEEGLGFTGAGQGIAAHCVAVLG